MPDFKEDITFNYNWRAKFRFTLFSTLIALGLIMIIILYLLFLKNSNNAIIIAVQQGIAYISSEIKAGSLIGALYAALFGGLFFIVVPTEAVFMVFIGKNHNPFALITIYISGFIISYTFNYFIGGKLASISKKIIGPTKFYKIKAMLNKHGSLAIFGFNALPLPSQPLATILGVFKYNKTRFYTMFITGQIVKYTVMAIGYGFFT